MSEQDFLDSYSGQTTAELLALEEIYRVDSIIMAFEQALEQKSKQQGLSNLTSLERMLLAIEALEREVNNGGYDQFFRNSSVEYTPIVISALNAIDCPHTAHITLDALSALGLSPFPMADEIKKVMDTADAERDEKLNDCDSRYYVTGENIALALFTYIKSHSNEVQLP
jgi:Domain of unknown function (DUF4375)